MKKIIRKNIFETNSSSTHSLTITKFNISNAYFFEKEDFNGVKSFIEEPVIYIKRYSYDNRNEDIKGFFRLKDKLNYLITYIAEDIFEKNNLNYESLTSDKKDIIEKVKKDSRFILIQDLIKKEYKKYLPNNFEIKIAFFNYQIGFNQEENVIYDEEQFPLSYGFLDEDRSNGLLNEVFQNQKLLYSLIFNDNNSINYIDENE